MNPEEWIENPDLMWDSSLAGGVSLEHIQSVIAEDVDPEEWPSLKVKCEACGRTLDEVGPRWLIAASGPMVFSVVPATSRVRPAIGRKYLAGDGTDATLGLYRLFRWTCHRRCGHDWQATIESVTLGYFSALVDGRQEIIAGRDIAKHSG